MTLTNLVPLLLLLWKQPNTGVSYVHFRATQRAPARPLRRSKITSLDQAVAFIQDGDTVSTCGISGTAFPENVIVALERRFLKTEKPRNLTLFYGGGRGRQGPRPELPCP